MDDKIKLHVFSKIIEDGKRQEILKQDRQDMLVNKTIKKKQLNDGKIKAKKEELTSLLL